VDAHPVSVTQQFPPIRSPSKKLTASHSQVDLDDNLRIWRSFKLGKLLDLVILDTRNYDRSITSLGWNDKYIDLIRNDASRSLMGSHQENWFYNQLSQSSKRGAAWRIIGSQIIFSQIGSSGDNWNGYIANRNRTLKHLYDNKIGNNIFLAGDSHQNWVSDVTWLGKEPYDSETGEGSIGVEFAGTAVSSSGPGGKILESRKKAEAQVKANEVLQWQEGYYRGYFVLSVKKEGVTAQYFGEYHPSPRRLDLKL
jgi:alkaline phosphatase D